MENSRFFFTDHKMVTRGLHFLSFDPYLKCVCGLMEPDGNRTNFKTSMKILFDK
ncbi:unnamed protein product, partial [Brassica oleracea var. botrytis]